MYQASLGALLFLIIHGCAHMPARDPSSLPELKDFAVSPPAPQDRGIPWKFTNVKKVVSIGDVQGDLDALLTILSNSKLIDDEGKWIGGETHLVIEGDLVNKGPQSRIALDFIIALEADIKKQGKGNLSFIYGNHELMLMKGIFRSTTEKDILAMGKTPFLESTQSGWAVRDVQEISDLFKKDSIYGEFLSRQNAIVQINDTIFVHAGLGKWAEKFDPDEINNTARAWVRFYLSPDREVGRPPEGTEWVVSEINKELGFKDDEVGPFFGREFQPRAGKPDLQRRFSMSLSSEELDQLLERWNAKRVLIGHIPYNSEIGFHPYYGRSVIMTDTRISRWSDPKKVGNLRWIEFGQRGELRAHSADIAESVASQGHPIRRLFEQKINALKYSAQSGCNYDLKKLLQIFGKD